MADTRRALTVELQDRIAAMREAGRSVAAIARAIDRSEGSVSYWCLKLGIDPKASQRPSSDRREAPILRGGRVLHRFTSEDDALLQALAMQGLTPSEIARAMTRRDPTRPRRPNTVIMRLMTLARWDERRDAA